MGAAHTTRLQAMAILLLLLLPCVAMASQGAENSATLTDIKFSFKLDPRLLGGTYAAEHWISPPTYDGSAAQDTVEAKAIGVGTKGQPVRITPRWIPSDPEMVTVSPDQGALVKIKVTKAGESKLQVTAGGVSKDLLIRSEYLPTTNAIQVHITQPKAQQTATPANHGDSSINSQVPTVAFGKKHVEQPTSKELADKNKQAGEAFLDENKSREGVVTLPSGLQYRIITEGTGSKPTLTDRVECNYRGTHLDGWEFASSSKRQVAAKFMVANAIPGWREALQLMPVGSKWQLVVPPQLAYGTHGTRTRPRKNGVAPKQLIGPNATLIFELELLSINNTASVASQRALPDQKAALDETSGTSREIHQ
jgi:FKBP-type peptidyl-prolyl cis-trans isomerase